MSAFRVNPKQQESGVVALLIRPEPAGPDAAGNGPNVRLKALLKVLLRRFGWRCVEIRETPNCTGRRITKIDPAPAPGEES